MKLPISQSAACIAQQSGGSEVLGKESEMSKILETTEEYFPLLWHCQAPGCFPSEAVGRWAHAYVRMFDVLHILQPPKYPSSHQLDSICQRTEPCSLPGLQSSTPQWVSMVLRYTWEKQCCCPYRVYCLHIPRRTSSQAPGINKVNTEERKKKN